MAAIIQISFHNMDAVPSAETQVRARVAELEQLSDRLTACRVVLDAAHLHPRHGRIYEVRIELSVPNGPIVVTRNPGADHAHEELSVAIRDAFDAARRRLQDHMRRMDGATKVHEER